MASIRPYVIDANSIFHEIQRRDDDAEANRRKEYTAARTIQRYTRGYLERKHIKNLHAAATIIQKFWRAFQGRRLYAEVIRQAVADMYREYYARKATCIQKLWRGYYVRSRVFNYYALKRWLLSVQVNNQLLLKIMRNYRLTTEAEMISKMEADAERWVKKLLYKLHHHLRTEVQPGIYSERNTTKLSPLEEQLKALKFVEYMDSLHQKRREMRKEYEERPRSPPPEGSHRRCETFWYKRIRVNQPSMTAAEKYKDEKTLRKERIEEQLKEKALRIHDKPMQFPRVQHDDSHLRMDLRTVKQQDHSRNMHPEEFKTTFKPIKFFDEMNKSDVGGPFLPPPESKTMEVKKFSDKYGKDVVIRKHREKCLNQKTHKDH